MILGTNYCGERGGTRYAQQYVHERYHYGPDMLVWAGIMNNAEHRFTPLREVTLRWNDIAKKLFWIKFIILGVR